jgi:uncharacterized membrane protein YfcA
MAIWLGYLFIGTIAGVLAGLLGVGGGVVLVPMLVFLFTRQNVCSPIVLHLALGTSLASIAFTSLASLRAHHGRGAVDWSVFRRITPGILAGSFFGSWLSAHLSTKILQAFFVGFLVYVATQMLLDVKPKPSRQLPGSRGLIGVGGLIGGVSSLVGIGGGSMSVPFLIWCNVSVRNAIGTSAAIGFPIAVAGALGYVANGLSAGSLPPFSLGFVYLPALLGIGVMSVLTAPLGAKLAHGLPVVAIKRGFAFLLLLVALKMLSDAFQWSWLSR